MYLELVCDGVTFVVFGNNSKDLTLGTEWLGGVPNYTLQEYPWCCDGGRGPKRAHLAYAPNDQTSCPKSEDVGTLIPISSLGTVDMH